MELIFKWSAVYEISRIKFTVEIRKRIAIEMNFYPV